MKSPRRLKAIAILSAITMAGGVAIAGYSGVQIYSAQVEVGKSYLPQAEKDWSAKTGVTTIQNPNVSIGTFLGTLSIPSLEKTINIFEGTDAKDLKRGAGHFVQSVMPGVSDNSVIAGHRDTVFANLGKIKVGASVVITVESGTFTYIVTKKKIVDKNDRTVIVPTPTATLTLSTCYPFSYIGSAPKRYIVTALLVEPLTRTLIS